MAIAEAEPASSPLAVSSYRYPTGWYVVSWSSDVPAGTVKKLHYFGQDLVCFRGQSGKLSVLDSYCQHLGGNFERGRDRGRGSDQMSLARVAMEYRRHQRPDSIQPGTVQAERQHPGFPRDGLVRLGRDVVRP